MSVTQVMEQYQVILEEEVHDIAYETGAVKRKGKLDVVTLTQMMIFGFWQDPALRLSGLAQIGGRREVHVTESAISNVLLQNVVLATWVIRSKNQGFCEKERG